MVGYLIQLSRLSRFGIGYQRFESIIQQSLLVFLYQPQLKNHFCFDRVNYSLQLYDIRRLGILLFTNYLKEIILIYCGTSLKVLRLRLGGRRVDQNHGIL